MEARTWLNLDRTLYLGGHLEVMCEVVAEQRDWAFAPSVIALAREESERGGLLALPLFADRLEGRLAARNGDWVTARTLLQRSKEGFESLSAPWEAAWSSYLLAEALRHANDPAAKPVVEFAVDVFEKLGSVRELNAATGLLAGAASA